MKGQIPLERDKMGLDSTEVGVGTRLGSSPFLFPVGWACNFRCW